MPDPKRKPSSSLRTPKPKKPLGLSVPPPIRMPHEELILATMPSMTSQTRQTSHTKSPKQGADSIAPMRDFTRVANSISRSAVPGGFFKGKSKQLYDCLYSLSRGAIVPSMTVRISRPKLMALAGIGARVTMDTNINHLSRVGLIEVRSIAGEHEGNEYTVYLPEETQQPNTETGIPSQTSLTSDTSLTRSTYKLDRLVRLETSQTRHTLNPDLPVVYDTRNTLLNTDDDDTHTLDEFAQLLLEGAREILGEKLPTTDQEHQRWKDCACVLLDELKDAAGKTTTISSLPAFFAAHLRRRFARKQKSKRQTPDVSGEEGSKAPGNAADPTAKSKFTIEDCRRYAEHLQKSGQGITNPGGYATTIYRTGEADALISAYLDEAAKPELPDANDCPDCNGTGFWYPRGIENGVVKCKHDRRATETP